MTHLQFTQNKGLLCNSSDKGLPLPSLKTTPAMDSVPEELSMAEIPFSTYLLFNPTAKPSPNSLTQNLPLQSKPRLELLKNIDY